MTFTEAVREGIEIVKLDRAAIRRVALEPRALSPALMITALVGIAIWLCPPHFSVHGIITGPLCALAYLIIGGAIIHIVALFFGGRGEIAVFLRVWGVSRVLGWLRIIPVIGVIADLWSLVIAVVILEELYGLDRTKAILTVVLPIGLLFLVMLIFVANLAILGGLLSLGHLF
ncbi:MAG: hypothetical protein KAY32_04060 [Candidatus Eisenbacteria sp.]|nr:hypothetical protein [Candidatus Eisenbacteria bacterium]